MEEEKKEIESNKFTFNGIIFLFTRHVFPSMLSSSVLKLCQVEQIDIAACFFYFLYYETNYRNYYLTTILHAFVKMVQFKSFLSKYYAKILILQ